MNESSEILQISVLVIVDKMYEWVWVKQKEEDTHPHPNSLVDTEFITTWTPLANI